MITITERAARRVEALLEQHPEMTEPGLRIQVAGGGCSGFTYKLGVEDGSRDGDEVVEAFGARLFVDGKSSLYLGSTEVDYEEGILQSGFKFHNPQATGTCGCGESFAV